MRLVHAFRVRERQANQLHERGLALPSWHLLWNKVGAGISGSVKRDYRDFESILNLIDCTELCGIDERMMKHALAH